MVRRIPRSPATDDPRWTSEVEPAPGELRIFQAFVNTAEPWTGTEELTSPRSLARWLRRWRLASDEVGLTAFYDDSPGRRRKWCSPRCANRDAARGYRRRRGIRPRGGARSRA